MDKRALQLRLEPDGIGHRPRRAPFDDAFDPAFETTSGEVEDPSRRGSVISPLLTGSQSFKPADLHELVEERVTSRAQVGAA